MGKQRLNEFHAEVLKLSEKEQLSFTFKKTNMIRQWTTKQTRFLKSSCKKHGAHILKNLKWLLRFSMYTLRARSYRQYRRYRCYKENNNTCINCPIVTRTDLPNTQPTKALNFRWCPRKLARHYGYQPSEVKEAGRKLTQTRYTRILVPKHVLNRLLERALNTCDLERCTCNFKRSSLDEEEYTTTWSIL